MLHPVLQQFFGAECDGIASGRLRVTRSPGWLRNCAATALGLPPSGDYELQLTVTRQGVGEHWVRHIGPFVMATVLTDYRRLLVETAGPGSLGFELAVEEGALYFRPRRAWVFGVPIPLSLAPRVEASNRPTQSGGWEVLVRFRLPLLGLVGEYAGEVWPTPLGQAADTGESPRS